MLTRSAALSLLFLLLLAPLAQAGVGFQRFTIPDPQGAPIEVGAWYPTDAPSAPVRLDLFGASLAADAPVKGDGLPLVVFSHGLGGSFADHHDTAEALADAGFVVAALTHTGDNWRDQSRAVGSIRERPRQLKVLVDYMLTAWPYNGSLAKGGVGAFGFSSGGLTVLTAAGGEPDMSRMLPHCLAHADFFDCKLVRRNRPAGPTTGPWPHDSRITAVVAVAPALGFTFSRQGLATVRQPVQLWRAEQDSILPHPHYAEAVRRALPRPAEFQLASGADHYDFLAPCSAALAERAPRICTSAPGFDRAAFHARFNREVTAFFERTLRPDRR